MRDDAGASTEEMVAGLKDALSRVTEIAVNRLGQEDMADEFVTTMNRAAEQAVPTTLSQFQGTIENMTLKGTPGIVHGPEDAANQYFREHSEVALREQFLPVVQETTASAGVTST